MTTKIKWRLRELPDVQELSLLVEKGILKQEEAREILFSLETEDDRDKKSLQDEIKFLRQVVEQLSNSRTKVIETIHTVQTPWTSQQPWWQPYQVYCQSGVSTTGVMGSGTSNMNNALYTTTGSSSGSITFNTDSPEGFSDIRTF